MTEAEWLAAIHPQPLLDHLDSVDALSDRKQRLLDCACVRRLWHLLRDEDARHTVEVAERYADGLADLDEMFAIREGLLATLETEAARNVRAISSGTPRPSSATTYDALAAASGVAWEYRGGTNPLAHAVEALAAEGVTDGGLAGHEQRKAGRFAELRCQVAVLWDIFGNPFCPIHVLPEWRTETVIALAQQMYYSRDFSAMPILADALMDAGCTDETILDHCRGGESHVRGCWVTDACVGKS